MKNTRLAALVAIASLFVAGCASDVKLDDKAAVPVETRNPDAAGANGGTGMTNSPVASVDLTKDNAAATAGRTVYFDYDSFVVKDEYRSVLEAQAKVLNGAKSKKLVIEGHTDERGGSEYNLALGQKRAQSVLKSLTLLGVPESQMEAVSFGKERPADPGHDEAAYAKNRRAELINR